MFVCLLVALPLCACDCGSLRVPDFSVFVRRVMCPRSGTKSSRLVMVMCVRVRVARVVRVSESTLPTLVNTLRSSKEPLGTIRKNPNYPPSGLTHAPGRQLTYTRPRADIMPLNHGGVGTFQHLWGQMRCYRTFETAAERRC